MRVSLTNTLRRVGHRGVLWLKIAVLIAAGLMPALVSHSASAAQLTSRKVTISTSAINATDVEHIFSFNIPNTSATKAGIIYDFCTTPVGTCTTPTGMNVESATSDSQTAWPNNGTAFTLVASDTGDCVITTNTFRVCYSRDEATATGITGGAVTHTISNITAPSSYQTVYVRISIYSNDDFAPGNLLDQGTVAEAYVRQLTVTGRVAERLEFCVAAIEDLEPAVTPASCATFPTTTDIAIGTIDHNAIYTTPVEPTATNLANDYFGAAMVNTNASGGVAVTYFPEPATSVSGGDTDQLRAFRVVPTNCSATSTSVTDQCFVSASNAGENFSAGTEKFGMFIPCIDGYQGSTGTNLASVAAYRGSDGDTTEASSGAAATCQTDETSNTNFAFDDSGAPAQIATSSTVVDDEMIKLSFGATASATTPEGSYKVVLTYIATPTF